MVEMPSFFYRRVDDHEFGILAATSEGVAMVLLVALLVVF